MCNSGVRDRTTERKSQRSYDEEPEMFAIKAAFHNGELEETVYLEPP